MSDSIKIPLLAILVLSLSACGPETPDRTAGEADAAAALAASEPAAETSSAPGAEAADPAAPESAEATVADADLPLVRVWAAPTCGCCGDWVEHMRAAGFPVEVHDVQNIAAVKEEHGIAPEHQSCHTALVDGYLVEGHVPADLVQRMLADRPEIRGLTVPGMPVGSPGMEVPGRKDPYDVLALVGDGSVVVYDSR